MTMIKRLLLFTVLFIGLSVNILAQDTYVVRRFGDLLANWSSGSPAYGASPLEALEELTSVNPAFRVGDPIMQALADKYNLPRSGTYLWDNYIGALQKEIDNGAAISISDIKSVPESMIDKKYKDVNYVSCDFRIKSRNGQGDLNETALFVLKNNKIAQISKYDVVVDKKGRRKIKVDLSGLELYEDTEGFGLSYNYSKAFPVGLSVNYSKWKFMIGVDFGINFDKDLYTTQKVDFTNIYNYSVTRGEYDLKYFVTATPAFFLKYFSVGWGFGAASLSCKSETTNSVSELSQNADGSFGGIVTSTSSLSGGEKIKFMMRPVVRGYIPCSDNFFISLSVNYDWILGYKEKSGIGFGVGIQYLLDD